MTQRLVTVLTDVDKIILRVNLMPVALELEINGSPFSIASSDSNTIFNRNFRHARCFSNFVDNWHIIVIRNKNVGRSSIENSILFPTFKCVSICDVSISSRNQMLRPEKVIQHGHFPLIVLEIIIVNSFIINIATKINAIGTMIIHVERERGLSDDALAHQEVNIKRTDINEGLSAHSAAHVSRHTHNAVNWRSETLLFRNQEILEILHAHAGIILIANTNHVFGFLAFKASASVVTLRLRLIIILMGRSLVFGA